MLLAVLERRAGIRLGDHDVYVSTVGGVKLTEPASDLAIALALASALKDKPIAPNVVAFGEVSLAGEVRPVTANKLRSNEAKRLGFSKTIDSSANELRAALVSAL
jgi:DNA repair protein RadA/Sms